MAQYIPNTLTASWTDKLSDRFLGTNKVNQINAHNQYEFQKATNINKYSWNMQGMVQAGMNPLLNAGATNTVANSQANGAFNTANTGELLDYSIQLIKEIGKTSRDIAKMAFFKKF